MKDERKTKIRLIEELEAARKRIAVLEGAESRHIVTEEAAPGQSLEQLDRDVDSLLTLESNILKKGLSSVLHLPDFQSLFEAFTEATGLVTAILDLEGKVLVATGWQAICTRFHRVHPLTARNCRESDLYLAGNVKPGEFVGYKCKNHLWDVVTPLVIGDHHLGNIYTGQFFYDDEVIDFDAFYDQADQCGFDLDEYLKALESVPRLSREKVAKAMHLLVEMTTMLAEKAYGNLRLTQMVSRYEEAGRALQTSVEWHRSILKSAMDGFCLVDMKGRLLQVNETYCLMSGYTEPELLQMNITDLEAVGNPADTNARRIQKILKRGEDRFESQHRRKDGSVFDSEISIQYQPRKGGRFIVFLRDITKRKKIEMELENHRRYLEILVSERTAELEFKNIQLSEAKDRAESADLLKSAFLATMSHELRTPLNSVIGFTGILLQEIPGKLNEEQQKQLRMVRGSARHLLALINDVLDISKIEAGQIKIEQESFELDESLQAVVGSIERAARDKGLSLVLTGSPGVVQVIGDRRRYEQVLLNLLSNAIKFTSTGSITFNIQLTADNMVTAAISDTGIGISKEDQANLFQPFYQVENGTNKKYEGTGLGLSICRRLVELMGGTIWVKSEPGAGSTFGFSVPVYGIAEGGE